MASISIFFPGGKSSSVQPEIALYTRIVDVPGTAVFGTILYLFRGNGIVIRVKRIKGRD
jgi:hypothetical protein